MKLFYSPSSPYARKVRIVAIEKGLHVKIEEIATNPFEETPENGNFLAANPLQKIPTLVLDDGNAIYDSRVICEYLDLVGHGPMLIPRNVDERVRCLTTAAMADGILDAAFNLVMELRRPVENQSQFWIERWTNSIDRAMNAFCSHMSDGFGMEHITAICAIDYVQLRLANMCSSSHELLEWRSINNSRISIAETMPN